MTLVLVSELDTSSGWVGCFSYQLLQLYPPVTFTAGPVWYCGTPEFCLTPNRIPDVLSGASGGESII